MPDDLSPVQEWRMGIKSDLVSTQKDVEFIKAEQSLIHQTLKNLDLTINSYNQNIETQLLTNKANIAANNRKGWVSVGMSFLVFGLVLVIHFGLTVGGVMAGVTSALGVVASIRKVI